MDSETLRAAIRAELREESYLVRRYCQGDTSIIGWTAGCALARLKRTGLHSGALEHVKTEVKRILDEEKEKLKLR